MHLNTVKKQMSVRDRFAIKTFQMKTNSSTPKCNNVIEDRTVTAITDTNSLRVSSNNIIV